MYKEKERIVRMVKKKESVHDEISRPYYENIVG